MSQITKVFQLDNGADFDFKMTFNVDPTFKIPKHPKFCEYDFDGIVAQRSCTIEYSHERSMFIYTMTGIMKNTVLYSVFDIKLPDVGSFYAAKISDMNINFTCFGHTISMTGILTEEGWKDILNFIAGE